MVLRYAVFFQPRSIKILEQSGFATSSNAGTTFGSPLSLAWINCFRYISLWIIFMFLVEFYLFHE